MFALQYGILDYFPESGKLMKRYALWNWISPKLPGLEQPFLNRAGYLIALLCAPE
jgi:hypothetical protein